MPDVGRVDRREEQFRSPPAEQTELYSSARYVQPVSGHDHLKNRHFSSPKTAAIPRQVDLLPPAGVRDQKRNSVSGGSQPSCRRRRAICPR